MIILTKTVNTNLNDMRMSLKFGILSENPAYERHRISRPMPIEATIQKKTYMDFSYSLRDLINRGWAAVNSITEH